MANIIDVPGQFRAREYGVKLANMSDIQDNVYGPYESVAAAHTALSAVSMNTVGTTVGITGADDTIVEYWYQGGTAQANLVPKKPNLAPVATSGSYNDLTDKPTIPDISGKADKSEMSVTPGTGANADKTTIQLKSGTSATVITQHQDISGKANTADMNTALGNKQDTIQDLSTIRSGAALGATAQQPATTLVGYGITDAYTKQEVNGLVSTPHQNYVTVDTFSSLPATGSADTIYRVSSYDGTQVDVTKYCEYAWNGSQFVLLAVKSQVDELRSYTEQLNCEAYFFIEGTATADGTVTITIDSNEYTAQISSGDTPAAAVTKIIAAIPANSGATCTNLYEIVKIEHPTVLPSMALSVPGLTSSNPLSRNGGYRSVVDESIVSGNSQYWRRSSAFPCVTEVIDYTNFTFKDITVEDGRVIWQSKTVSISTNLTSDYLYLRNHKFIVPNGYELVLIGVSQTIDIRGRYPYFTIRPIDRDNDYDYVVIRNNNNGVSLSGHLIDKWHELKQDFITEYVTVYGGRIPYTIDGEGAVTITNPYGTQTYYSWYSVISKGGKIFETGGAKQRWTTQTIPDGSMLVLNTVTLAMDVRVALTWTVWGGEQIGQNEVVLLINNHGAFDGLWAEYLRAYTKYNIHKNEIYPNITIKQPERIGNHDMTIVGNEIWHFSSSEVSMVYRIDKNTFDHIGTFYQHFTEEENRDLEWKSVDWNNNTYQLLVGNGSAKREADTDKAFIYVFYDCANWPTQGTSQNPLTFNNCGEYKQIQVNELGKKAYAFWARTQDDMIYVSVNKLTDIYLIKLGKGTDDLGHGTYEAAAEGKFNGSWVVCREWHQYLDDHWSGHGGQVWNGSLYIAPNNPLTCEVYKLLLKSDGNIEFDKICMHVYQNSGALKAEYIDGVCIDDDGRIIVDPINRYHVYLVGKLK